MAAESIRMPAATHAKEQATTQEWVWLARIRKPQGRKGEVLAEILTDFPEKFSERKHVWLLTNAGSAQESAREAALESYFLHKGSRIDVVLHFGGVQSIPEAEALRNQVVAIPRADRLPLSEDEAYIGDLIGCQLMDLTTEPATAVGVIEGVDRDAGPVDLLVIKGAGKSEEILVPFAKAYLRKIDFEARRVEMALPEGLVEVQLS
jgi:16S rRNA processing protein RimM